MKRFLCFILLFVLIIDNISVSAKDDAHSYATKWTNYYNKRQKKSLKNDKGQLYVGKYDLTTDIATWVQSDFNFINYDISYLDYDDYYSIGENYWSTKGIVVDNYYLSGYKYTALKTTVKDMAKNVGWIKYGSYDDILNDNSIFQNGEELEILSASSNKYAYSGYKYSILVNIPNRKTRLKDCKFLFNASYYNIKEYNYATYGFNIKTENPNDYLFKKTFSLQNAPSYDDFEEDFLKKIKGKGKSLITFTEKDRYDTVSITACIPIENYYMKLEDIWCIKHNIIGDAPTADDGKLCISYEYDKSTRKCISVTYDLSITSYWT